MSRREWDPNEWQAYCCELMTIHYGARVQIIPDRSQGDGGLEAYVADEATAYQCYAPEDPFTLKAQTEAQKSKIRADTKKLLDHPERTQSLIGVSAVIEQWVLLTPYFEDKSLIDYANRRAGTVSSKAAEGDQKWCSPNLRISIHDDSLFTVAKAQLLGTQSSQLRPNAVKIDLPDLRSSGAVDVSFDATLERKLAADPRLLRTPDLLANYRDETLSDYFIGKAELARLARDAAVAHSAVQECANVVFAGLARAIAESDERPIVVVKGIREQLNDMVSKRLIGFSPELCLILARFFIASWWLECPLQFEASNA